jgi:hypothetical protein
VGFDTLDGGTGESTTYVPQFAAFREHAKVAPWLPLQEVLLLGDRKMPTEANQVTWLRLGLGDSGPVTMQAMCVWLNKLHGRDPLDFEGLVTM